MVGMAAAVGFLQGVPMASQMGKFGKTLFHHRKTMFYDGKTMFHHGKT